mmetsp:Transcript_52557/g.125165  ORF Transcript_52557/g.125165 Transcript_52557/m.125165 type:complete len:213 (+) Transcript_52557:333-971(+)
MADMMKDAESLRKPEGKEEKAARREKRKLEEAQGDRHAGEDVDGSGAAKDASGVAPKKRKHPKGLPEGSDGKISVGVSPFAMATASRLDDGESDTDSEEEEEEEEELETGGINSGPLPAQAAPHGPSKLSFGDRAVGTGTIVEVEEMDMSELLRGAASSTLLPALPKPDGPMSNRLKKKIKGPQRRQLKKDKLQKTKRSIRGDKVKKAKGKS